MSKYFNRRYEKTLKMLYEDKKRIEVYDNELVNIEK